jgi:hypothetical protein
MWEVLGRMYKRVMMHRITNQAVFAVMIGLELPTAQLAPMEGRRSLLRCSKELFSTYRITTMPSNICSAHLASPIPAVVSWWLPIWQWTAEIADLYDLGLQRIAPLPWYRPLPGLSHHYHAQQHLQCPLGFYHTCSGLMVAAYLAADCRNSRLVRLGPPAHCPITSVQTSTRLIASLPCPATSSVPTWLLPYLRWSHGGCLDDGGQQKFQI